MKSTDPRRTSAHFVPTILLGLAIATSLYMFGAEVTGNAARRTVPWIYLVHILAGTLFIFTQIVWLYLAARRLSYSTFLLAALFVTGFFVFTRSGHDFFSSPHILTTHVVLAFVVISICLVKLKNQSLKLSFAAAFVPIFAVLMFDALQSDEASRTESGSTSPFAPAAISTPGMRHLPASTWQADQTCRRCHAEVHDDWAVSAHRFASFNNPAYRFTVLETRKTLRARDSDSTQANLCAGCHDPIPLLSGAFADENFDLPHPEADLGITCLTCHAVSRVTSVTGNASFHMEPPPAYPFATSVTPALQWLHDRLLKTTPDLHKTTHFKPLHKTSEFCSTCHKVHLPSSLNGDRWLRGQNHYDSFLLSGVSGHSARAFYYPDTAVQNCQACHMQDRTSDGLRHDFPGANTALAALRPDLLSMTANERHIFRMKDSVTVDLLTLGSPTLPVPPTLVRPDIPSVSAGQTYDFEVVIANRRVGHHFTQGTSDSNQVWLEVTLVRDGEILASNGSIDSAGRVDPNAYFLNAWQIDRQGRRIDRRNAQDIHATLYDHQIPPGSADVVHFQVHIPDELEEGSRIDLNVHLHYRKFDTNYFRLIKSNPALKNDLPIATIASDVVTFTLGNESRADAPDQPWRRLNDYGIALLRKPGGRAHDRAIEAFTNVAESSPAEGYLNLARAHLAAGHLTSAQDALDLARQAKSRPWTLAWVQALIDLGSGNLDRSIENLERIVTTQFPEAEVRGFDFSRDYEVHNELANAYVQRGQIDADQTDLEAAATHFRTALALDPENPAAHYGISRVLQILGDHSLAVKHLEAHELYRVDEAASGAAVSAARTDPVANHAADPLAIYLLSPESSAPDEL